MSDRVARIALAATCLAGAAVTGFLLSTRLGSAELLCSTGGCKTVQDSAYAELAGLPVAALGLAAYVVVGTTALGTQLAARAAGAAVALAGAAFSAYLLVVQLAVIGAVCDWCLASDGIVSFAATLALLRLRGALVSAPAQGRGRMKRHVALLALSHGHHHMLVHALRLCRAADDPDGRARARVGRAFVDFFAHEALEHFRAEEEGVFRLVARHAGNDDARLIRALEDHVDLQALAARLAHDVEEDAADPGLLRALGTRLRAHVDLEERELFPLVERAAADELAGRD